MLLKIALSVAVVVMAFQLYVSGMNASSPTTTTMRVKQPLHSNYTRKTGERLRLECDFELHPATGSSPHNPNDFTIYWVKNYQELLQTKKGQIHVIRRNLTTILILRNLDSFDSGSYMCIAELSNEAGALLLNASSDTTLFVRDPTETRKQNVLDDYLLGDLSVEEDSDLGDEFPQLNPTIVENFEDKGFCEPYKGSICAGIITANYSVYSTSAQQQELIEERLRSIIPLLSNKNSLSPRCSTFAVSSLCLFAFPLCDKHTRQPKQVCRYDCKQLQQDICKNEYFNAKSLFSANKLENNHQQSSSFLLDCNQLPPSSDSPNECLPIITMTLNNLESQAIEFNNKHKLDTVSLNKVVQEDQCINGNGVDYRGTQAFTRNNFPCQRWDAQYSEKYLKGRPDLIGHNYCRNVDNDVEPWCFTGNPQQPKDYCNIAKCVTAIENSNYWYTSLPNMVAIVLPTAIIIMLLIVLLVFYCRCCRRAVLNDEDNLKSSMNSNNVMPLTTATSLSSNGAVTTHIQPQNRLRMSNASLGKKTQANKNNFRAAGSSKSSVASSSNNKNPEQLNPFIKNYENDAAHFNNFNQQFQPQFQQQTDYTIKNFSPNNIRLLQEIGKGRFGSVYTGELIGANSIVKATIKTLKPVAKTNMRNFHEDNLMQTTSTPNVNNYQASVGDAASHFNEQEFYNEISLYSSIRNRHLANLIGVYTTNYAGKGTVNEGDEQDDMAVNSLHPQCMVFEHLNSGDLHEYLLQRACGNGINSAAIYNGMMAGSQSNLSAISSSIGGVSSNYLNLQQQQRNVADFLYIGQQIASGMEYLASQNFILKDLATRNILMSDNLTIKISIDLIAQYKECYAKDYYKFQSKMLPVRWMPPESLLYGRYNQQSDVWSFGVCLWEIFNYGCQPYSGCTNPEAIEMIRDRQLLLIPDECPQRAYALMLECWHEMPMQRPTFTEILNRLRNWENYYLFNNQPVNNNANMMMPPPPPLPLPLHLQHQHQQQFGMTASYSSNSQNSKASSLLGNTASTGISSSCSPPPLPPPLHMSQMQAGSLASGCYSPNKMAQFPTGGNGLVNGVSTNLFMSKFNANNATNSLRMSQRNFNCNIASFNLNNGNSNSNIPINNNINSNNNGPIDMNHHFDL